MFLKARKPKSYNPVDLSDIALYSAILGRRTISIPSIRDISIFRRLKFIGLENLIKLGKFLIYQGKVSS